MRTIEGTIFLSFSLPFPWPPERPSSITHDLEDGMLLTEVGAPDVIALRAETFAGKLVWSAKTCPITIEAGAKAIVSVSWSDSRVVILRVNANDVLARQTPLHIPVVARGEQYTVDFTEKNQRAIIKRRGKHRVTPKAGMHYRGLDYLLDSLKAEFEQLHDLLDLVHEGKLSHIPGIAARLRVLISRNGQNPLLQATASAFDLPLIVYTTRDPKSPPPISIHIGIFLQEISPVPIDYSPNPIDLDVWLGNTGLILSNQHLSHEEIIVGIANTVGSHLDQNVLPSVLALRSLNTNLSSTQQTALAAYIVEVAQSVMGLCKFVLDYSRLRGIPTSGNSGAG